jgi:hypothetical protein
MIPFDFHALATMLRVLDFNLEQKKRKLILSLQQRPAGPNRPLAVGLTATTCYNTKALDQWISVISVRAFEPMN